MGTTATYALRYPSSLGNVDLWTHYQNLADDVDVVLLNKFGCIRRWRRETNRTSTGGVETPVMRIDNIPFKANVLYLVMTNSLELQTISGETGYVIARLSTSGVATIASAQIGSAKGNANTAFDPRQGPTLVAEHTPAVDQTGSVWLGVGRSGGSGDVILRGSSVQPICLYIMAFGKNPGLSGVDL